MGKKSDQMVIDFAIVCLFFMSQSLKQSIQSTDESICHLTKSQSKCMDLLLCLRASKVSLRTCKSMMEWHLQALGKLKVGQKLAHCKDCISRCKVHKVLKECYQISPNVGVQLHKIVFCSHFFCLNLLLFDF